MSDVIISKSHLTILSVAIVLVLIIVFIACRRIPTPLPPHLNNFLQNLNEGAAATIIDKKGQLVLFDKNLLPVEPCGVNDKDTSVPPTCVPEKENLSHLNRVTILRFSKDSENPGSFIIAADDTTYYHLCPDGTWRQHC